MSLRAFTNNVRRSTAVGLFLCTVSAICLGAASFIVPPTGIIDPSVIKFVAWLFAFAALFELREAVREGMGFKLTHGDTTVEVKDVDGNQSDPQNPEEHEA